MTGQFQWFFVSALHEWESGAWIDADVRFPEAVLTAWHNGQPAEEPPLPLLLEAAAQAGGILRTVTSGRLAWAVMAKCGRAERLAQPPREQPWRVRVTCEDESPDGARYLARYGDPERPWCTFEMMLGYGPPPGAEHLPAPFREDLLGLCERFAIALPANLRHTWALARNVPGGNERGNGS